MYTPFGDLMRVVFNFAQRSMMNKLELDVQEETIKIEYKGYTLTVFINPEDDMYCMYFEDVTDPEDPFYNYGYQHNLQRSFFQELDRVFYSLGGKPDEK